MNKLFYGDCLEIMRQGYLSKNSVDLIYLDPPFNSKKNYNLMYRTMTGLPVSEQVEAFCDTWELDADKERAAREMPVLMREKGVDEYYIDFWHHWIKALRNTQPRTLAYLIYMVERLLWMRHILKPTGSLYLHCDTTVSHYIKVMLDGIFGHGNFRNEIIWKRTTTHSDSKTWSRVSDSILFYTRGPKFTWNTPHEPHSEAYRDTKYRYDDGDGRGLYRLDNMTSPSPRHRMMYEWKGFPHPANGWRYKPETMRSLDENGRIWYPKRPDGSFDTSKRPQLKRYLSTAKGGVMGNIWTDISPVNSQATERLGYPTQKPTELLDRIVLASSKKGDVVFDPFCGCGTTIYSAHKNQRRWVGCDIAILAIRLVKTVLSERYGLVEGAHYEVDGIPVSVEQAQELFKRDPFQFQHWAVELVGGFPSSRRSGDKGIDGRLYFETLDSGLKEMVISVKGGKLRPSDVRDLVGVVLGETTGDGGTVEMGAFLSLQEPTAAMREAAAKAGMYEYRGAHYPRVQLLTVREILEEGRELRTPTTVKVKGATGQTSLPLVQRVQGDRVAE